MEETIDSVFALRDSFMHIYDEETNKLPYHVNIIDELHADENAHTRILLKFLSYKKDNSYPLVISFIKLMIGKRDINFPYDKVYKPIVLFNKEYIDGLILEQGKYAIIIENKINWAIDQDKQIERYVNTALNKGLNKENIFVVYLTQDGNKKIGKNSLTDKVKSLLGITEETQGRFIELNYREDILPWLKNDILPNCIIKEDWLVSALKQYIDHLEGRFGLRTIKYKMNMELQEYLKAVMKLGEQPEINHQIIKQKISDINKISNQLLLLKDDTEKGCWKLWLDRLKKDFPNYNLIENINAKKYPNIGVIVENKGVKYGILIEYDSHSIYYGIGRHFSSQDKKDEVEKFVLPILDEIGGFKPNRWWYGLKNTSFENAYCRLSSLIKEVNKRME